MPTNYIKKIIAKCYQRSRKFKFLMLSTCKNVSGKAKISQPVLFHGLGSISFGQDCKLGYKYSPGFYDGSIYIEARNTQSRIIFGKKLRINNNCTFISEGDGIEIGDNTFIGMNTIIMDTDGHPLEHTERNKLAPPKTFPVRVGCNVFIGANVTILKGVTVGDCAVIAAGSVVTKNIPAHTVHAGNPARAIKSLQP